MKRATFNRLRGALSAFTGLFPPPFKEAVARRMREAELRADEDGISVAEAIKKGFYEHIQGQLCTLGIVILSVGGACSSMATQGYTWVVPVLGCTPFVTLTVLSVLVFRAERNE